MTSALPEPEPSQLATPKKTTLSKPTFARFLATAFSWRYQRAKRTTVAHLTAVAAVPKLLINSAVQRIVDVRLFVRQELGAQLWRHAQHRPRPLYVPTSYASERPPANAPRIGIVTPSYNHAKFLTATIESVLSQAYPNLDYIVQDGGSKDGTVELLESFTGRLRWRSEIDSGQGNAINRGFSDIDAEIMGYLNSDDTLLPGTLAYVARFFLSHPDVDVIYGHRVNIDQSGMEIGRCVLPPYDAETLKWADYVPQETMFWRRRVWDRVGPIDESLKFALDWDFILRSQAAGFAFHRAPRFLACFRIHADQKTAAMMGVGNQEMFRLRKIHLGYEPEYSEIEKFISPYLKQQSKFHWLYKFGLLQH